MYAMPFVLAILMVLSILSYSNVRTFMNFQITQESYQNYMRHTEQQDYNERVKEEYEKRRGQQRDPADNPQKHGPNLNGILNIHAWLESSVNESKKQPYGLVLTRLMHILCDHHPAFEEFRKERSDFIEQIVARLKNRDKPMQNRLSSIDLGDRRLQEAFVLMLKGNITREEWEEKLIRRESLIGYHRPLTDFVEYSPQGDRKLSIYLAKKELLQAVYGDPSIVDTIIATRNDYSRHFQSRRKQGAPPQDLQHFSPLGFDVGLFDFSTSGTKPPEYASSKQS